MNTKLDQLVNRFLAWPVPADVHPDGTPGQPGRTGTNLLSAPQAKQMLEHVLGGVSDDTMPARDCGNYLVDVCHAASANAGWWTHKSEGVTLDLIRVINAPLTPMEKVLSGALVAQKLCLIHSEISEAMEGHRKGLMDDKLQHRPMIEVELADAVIRICDLAGALGLDLGGAIAEKLAFNAQRPDHKPEARAAAGGKAY